jgi:hypothetical protein
MKRRRRTLRNLLLQHDDELITYALNEVYGGTSGNGQLDPVLGMMQLSSVEQRPIEPPGPAIAHEQW